MTSTIMEMGMIEQLHSRAGGARDFGGAGFMGRKLFYFAGIKSGTGQTDAWEFSPPA